MTPNPIQHRRERIKALVVEQGFCTIGELAAALSVSEMTIRRDVAFLEQTEEQLRSVHGGVSAVSTQLLAGSDFRLRSSSRPTVKEAIGRGALEFVPANGAIAIDAGTTTFEFARALPRDNPLKIVTHSIPILNAMLGHAAFEVTGLGGTLQHSSQSLIGANTIATVADIHVGCFFMGASGVNQRGIFCGNDFEAVIKRALISVADKVILLADSSKFSSAAMIRVCSLEAISAMVVDDGISDEWCSFLEGAGVSVVVVSSSDMGPDRFANGH